MADQGFHPEEGSSMERPREDSGVVSRSIINGPNKDTGPVMFSAEDMANTGDHLEVYLADDPNPLEIHFPTENFVEFCRDVRKDREHIKGRSQIDLLENMYPTEGRGVSWAGDNIITLTAGRGVENFGGFARFESPKVSGKHCQISFDLISKTLTIENFEDTMNPTEVIRKHKEASIDDFASPADTSVSPEAEVPSQSPKVGILRKYFDRFMGKFEEDPKLFKDYAATSEEASYRDTFLENEDRLVVNEKAGVFAVFDGMGGGSGGALAADIAAEVVTCRFKGHSRHEIDTPQEALDDLVIMMEDINSSILDDPNSDKAGTTATIARLIHGEDGTKSLAWVSVGDSRLYLSEGINSSPEQITTDETADDVPEDRLGSMLTNCLGWGKGSFRGVEHAGIIKVASGNRIILCTDGITGDKGDELMFEAEIEELTRGLGAAQAAKSLLENARKNDDRTAIVVDL